MVPVTLTWGSPVVVATAGDIGGLAQYYTGQAQDIYLDGSQHMAMKSVIITTGIYGAPGDVAMIESDIAYSLLRIDNSIFGVILAAWVAGGVPIAAVYNYAADISDIMETCETLARDDTTIKQLSATVKNKRADLFDSYMSFFAPGAVITLYMAMGDCAAYAMGKYYLDTAPYDRTKPTLSISGRSRLGWLLKETTFDVYGDPAKAIFTGNPAQIITAILLRYSDGDITVNDLVIQSIASTFTATFNPDDYVLDGITKWLTGFGTSTSETHAQLSYGATGSEVSLAQRLLNNNMGPTQTKLSVDGDFGNLTKAAVDAFQKAKGLTVTHVIDDDTWAALLGYTGDWSIEELYDGKIVVGDEKFIATYKPIGHYTFTRELDVKTRSIDRSMDDIYSRIGVKYQVDKADAYVFVTVKTWPAWVVPSHRTNFIDAPEGATQQQAQALAESTALDMQFVGIGEELDGPIRPELLVGDIAQISEDGGSTSTITGIITEVRHNMGEDGFFTSFYTDSGGTVMQVQIDDEGSMVEVTRTSKTRHRRRLGNAVKKIIHTERKW